MKLTMHEIQQQAGEWRERNFPHQPQHHPVLGICEEVGELAEAYLAGDQAKIADSLGDISIYAMNLCNNEGTDARYWAIASSERRRLGEVPQEDDPARMLLRAVGRAGQIAHAFLKREQGIRLNEDHTRNLRTAWGDLWTHLFDFADRFDIFLPDCLRHTWAEVSKRDWQRNATTGEAA